MRPLSQTFFFLCERVVMNYNPSGLRRKSKENLSYGAVTSNLSSLIWNMRKTADKYFWKCSLWKTAVFSAIPQNPYYQSAIPFGSCKTTGTSSSPRDCTTVLHLQRKPCLSYTIVWNAKVYWRRPLIGSSQIPPSRQRPGSLLRRTVCRHWSVLYRWWIAPCKG